MIVGILCLAVLLSSAQVSGFGYLHFRDSFSRCQEWKYENTSCGYRFRCHSYFYRVGACPRGCEFPEDFRFQPFLHCNFDSSCPNGYKCCVDECYRHHKICRPAYYASEASTYAPDATTTDYSTLTPTKWEQLTEISDITTNIPEIKTTATEPNIMESSIAITIPSTTGESSTRSEDLTTELAEPPAQRGDISVESDEVGSASGFGSGDGNDDTEIGEAGGDTIPVAQRRRSINEDDWYFDI